jgi:hypothetical protein
MRRSGAARSFQRLARGGAAARAARLSGSSVSAETLSVESTSQTGACFDTYDRNTPVAYDPVATACNSGGGSGAFRWSLDAQASGDALVVSVRAAAVADGASGNMSVGPASGVYQAGRVDFEIFFSVDVPGGAAWEIDFDHGFLGLSALRSDGAQNVPLASSFALSSLVGAVSTPCALALSPTGLGGFGTGSFEVSAAASCPASWSGVGDALLSLPVSFTIEALSVASEAAFLLGLDDALPLAGVTADDYASWGRSHADDGYTFTLSLRATSLPEPACALLAAPLAAARHRLRCRRGASSSRNAAASTRRS